jgi:hypothetical protein
MWCLRSGGRNEVACPLAGMLRAKTLRGAICGGGKAERMETYEPRGELANDGVIVSSVGREGRERARKTGREGAE